MGIAFVFALLENPEILAPFAAIGLPFAAIETWRQFLKSQRAVVIDKVTDLVKVHTVSIWGRRRSASYPLSRFRFVASYITPGKNPVNYLELLSHSGGEALPLREFAPVFGKTPFLSLSGNLQENAEAAVLRQRVASYAGLEDRGFIGIRMTGALLSDRGT
ncbi:MAG: hypothetical protein EOO32_02060 [Comamonadaceae bacterium]|nr:MAG: hypothetical protein EOO32_02060 [Comamonadaceae bacterium]